MSSSRPSACRAWVKPSSTWVEVSSTETTSVSHLRLTRSSVISTAHPGCREVPADRTPRPGQRPKVLVCQEKDPAHAGRRHPHPAQVGTAVRELTVTAISLAPLLEQRQDLRGLLGQQPVQRRATRLLVGQRSAGPAPQPAMRHEARRAPGPDKPGAATSPPPAPHRAGRAARPW